ncbi:MAG: flagellar hook-basal body complex protein FliE, partial [Pseudomonadota bacterium]
MKVDAARLMSIRAEVLARNEALASAAMAKPADAEPFAGAMTSAIDSVASLQADSARAVTAFQSGESHDVAAMMVARQKSSLGFQATLQIRNKLLSAYKDIMN